VVDVEKEEQTSRELKWIGEWSEAETSDETRTSKLAQLKGVSHAVLLAYCFVFHLPRCLEKNKHYTMTRITSQYVLCFVHAVNVVAAVVRTRALHFDTLLPRRSVEQMTDRGHHPHRGVRKWLKEH